MSKIISNLKTTCFNYVQGIYQIWEGSKSKKIDYHKLLGENATVELNDLISSDYFTSLVTYLIGLSQVKPLSISPNKAHLFFKVFRDLSEALRDPKSTKVFIYGESTSFSNLSNGRAFTINTTVPSVINRSSSLKFLRSEYSKYYNCNGDITPYLDPTGDHLLNEGVLLIPMSLVKDTSEDADTNLLIFKPLFAEICDMINLNFENIVHVLTSPDQEYLINYLDTRDSIIVKQYELDPSVSLFEHIDELRETHGYSKKSGDIYW